MLKNIDVDFLMNADMEAESKVDILEFYRCISDLLDCSEVMQLDNYSQHMNTSRLQHSLNVAFCSYLICKKLNCNYRSAARAGVLHDLFLYDWREQKQPEGNHAIAHPIVALRNAKKITDINHIEENAILAHMWPLSPILPKYKESIAVTLADKYCTCYEITLQFKNKLEPSIAFIKSVRSGGVFAR